MSEFNNRIAAQREILRSVNAISWREELFGLSSGAIDRWASSNRIEPASILLSLIKQAAERLFFLANKSQEQITEEYRLLCGEVAALTAQIRSATLQA